MSFVILWEFEARPDQVVAFERAYGPAGDWALLFKHGVGYGGTELLRDRERPRTYVTIDRWQSQDAYRAFRAGHASRYQAIDRQYAALTVRERMLGEYETMD